MKYCGYCGRHGFNLITKSTNKAVLYMHPFCLKQVQMAERKALLERSNELSAYAQMAPKKIQLHERTFQ